MKNTRKAGVIIAALLIFLAGVLAVLEVSGTTHVFKSPDTADNTGIPGPINYGPPTEAEKQDSESHKDAPSDKTGENSPSQTHGQKTVEVAITTWTQKDNNIQVNGFVSGVVEDGGVCTLTLTSSTTGKQVSSSRSAVANATNTSCGASTIAVSRLSPGEWQAVLSYSSSTSTGKSDPLQLEVH